MCQYARFTAGWGFIDLPRWGVEEVMEDLGAVYYRKYRCRGGCGSVVFEYFFLEDDTELGYYANDMTTLIIHDTPRVWGMNAWRGQGFFGREYLRREGQ